MNLVKRNLKVKTTMDFSAERHPVPVVGIDYKVKIVYKSI